MSTPTIYKIEPCPRISPESRQPCHLLDTAREHEAGHESALVNGRRVSWATDWFDRNRWGTWT